MSDTPQGPGWWIADDGAWYSPELHPDPEYVAKHAHPEPDQQSPWAEWGKSTSTPGAGPEREAEPEKLVEPEKLAEPKKWSEPEPPKRKPNKLLRLLPFFIAAALVGGAVFYFTSVRSKDKSDGPISIQESDSLDEVKQKCADEKLTLDKLTLEYFDANGEYGTVDDLIDTGTLVNEPVGHVISVAGNDNSRVLVVEFGPCSSGGDQGNLVAAELSVCRSEEAALKVAMEAASVTNELTTETVSFWEYIEDSYIPTYWKVEGDEIVPLVGDTPC